MKSNYDKAKQALIDSGFVSAYYYIRSVMEGNVNSTVVRHETATRAWAVNVLNQKEALARKKYPKYSAWIPYAAHYYYDTISERHHEIIDQIIKNKVEKSKENEKKEEPKRPIIAIDVDGVLRNNLGLMVDMYNKEFGKDMKVEDVKEFKTEKSFPEIQTITGMTPSSWFFTLHSKELFLDAPAYDSVADDIVRLQEVADIVIVTYQKDYRNKRYTLKWLEKHGIKPNGICFLRDKTLLHSDILIDDNDWNFIGTHAKHSVLVNAPYNVNLDLDELKKQTHSDTITRVGSFHEFVDGYLNGTIKMET